LVASAGGVGEVGFFADAEGNGAPAEVFDELLHVHGHAQRLALLEERLDLLDGDLLDGNPRNTGVSADRKPDRNLIEKLIAIRVRSGFSRSQVWGYLAISTDHLIA